MLHMTIIFGGGLVMMLGEPLVGLMILLLVKIFMDIRAHISEQLGRSSIIDVLREKSRQKQATVTDEVN